MQKKLILPFLFLLLLSSCATPTPAPTPIPPTATATAAPTSTPTPAPPTWSLVWADEFDQPDGSAPDPKKWNHQQGGAGWGNGELQYYTNDIKNAFIENDMLVIRALKEYTLGRDYSSARLNTMSKGSWMYGRFEIRAKLPTTQGIWPAFWLLPARARYGSGAAGGEIDIMELVGSEPGRSYGTLHYGNPAEHSSGYYDLPQGVTYSDDFHVFAVEWEEKEIRWYIDDVLFHTATEWFTTGRKDAKFPAPYNQEFYFLVNVAVGGYWPGSPDETSTFPQTMYVDYVRIYQHPK